MNAPVVQQVHVRIGTPDDIHPMVALALCACEENGFISPNPVKLATALWAALNLHQGIVGIIGAPGETIEGAVLLSIGNNWYSDENFLEEKAIFVAPEYRSAKGGRAKLLCEFSKMASDKLRMPLTLGVLSSARTEAKIRMYRRIMGEPSGAYWLYGSTTGHHSTVENKNILGEIL